jgi:tetratricopeptide (TPR) repeat protein
MNRLFTPKPWRLPFYAAMFLFAIHCASTNSSRMLPYEKPRSDQVAKARAEEIYIKACDLERRHLKEDALDMYVDAYKLDPTSKTLRNIIVARYIESGRFTPALLLIKGRKKNHELGSEEKRMVAEIYLRTREFQKAVETLESIIDKSGADYYSLAIIYEAIGDNPKALTCYTAFSERSTLSLERGLKIARMQLSQEKYKAADSLIARLERRFGENAPVENLRGMLSLALGDTTAALDLFTKAAATDSLFDEAVRNKALLYLQKNDYKNAISGYETLYRRSSRPFDEVYGRTLAILYFYNKDYGKAEALFGKLCENLVNDEEIHFYIGLVYAAQLKNNMARIELEKSLSLRNDFFDAWRELVGISMREKKLSQALTIAERCTRKVPHNPASWRLLGYVFNVKKEYARAIPAYLKATAIDSLDASAWFDLGSTYERNKDIENAAAAFKRALKLKPGDVTILNYLGYMWADRGIKLDSAKRLVTSALIKEPDNGAFLDSYAWIFFKMGNMDSAYIYQEKAVLRIHDDPVVFEHLGDILRERNNYREAVEAYKKSIELNGETPDLIRQKIIALEPFLHHE